MLCNRFQHNRCAKLPAAVEDCASLAPPDCKFLCQIIKGTKQKAAKQARKIDPTSELLFLPGHSVYFKPERTVERKPGGFRVYARVSPVKATVTSVAVACLPKKEEIVRHSNNTGNHVAEHSPPRPQSTTKSVTTPSAAAATHEQPKPTPKRKKPSTRRYAHTVGVQKALKISRFLDGQKALITENRYTYAEVAVLVFEELKISVSGHVIKLVAEEMGFVWPRRSSAAGADHAQSKTKRRAVKMCNALTTFANVLAGMCMDLGQTEKADEILKAKQEMLAEFE